MKRSTLIALGILVVLVAVYFITSEEPPKTVRAPLTIEKVEGLIRVELTPPAEPAGKDGEGKDEEGAGQDKPDLIALEKRDGEWWLTRPVEAPAAGDVGDTIEEAFGENLRTDDIRLSAENAADYEVDDARGVGLLLRGKGGKTVELIVGKQMTVEGTGVKRTYVRKPGSDEIYRAQVAIGDFVRQGVDELRSDEILDLKRDAVSRLELEHKEGPTIVLEKGKDAWKILRPEVDFQLDGGAVDSLVGALASLDASGFADDKPAGELGLDSPKVTVKVTADGADHTLEIGRVGGDDKPTYYATKPDQPFKYKLSTYAGKKLDAGLGDIRSKTPREFDAESIEEVEFPGDDNVLVTKIGGKWKLVRPTRDKAVNTPTLQSKLKTVASLRVKGFPDISAEEAGLTGGADRLVARTGDREYTILFGDKVGDTADRYVTFADDDEVYVVSEYTANKLYVEADSLVGEPDKGKRPGGRKMPGGAKKRKLMRQLQKQMGNR